MAKLPPYVFRRPNGSYRYKRNVPKKLRPLVGKDTLYRQLGDSYAEAMQNLPKVHAQIEQLFHTEAQIPSNERALAIIRGALGDEVAGQVLAGKVAEYSREDYALNDLARDLAGKLPQDVVRQVHAGRLQAEAMTLQTALGEYKEYKLEDDPDSRETEQRVARLRKDLADAIGAQRVKSTPLTDITRADANALRDHLLTRMKPSSVKRYITVIKAAVNYVIAEHTLNIPNVFNGVRIKGATATSEDRLPLSDADFATVLPTFAEDPVAHAVFVTLADTGARLAEITGLEVQDVDLQQACVHLRPNSIRRLKTKSSKRTIPLSSRALELLQQHRHGKEDGDPIFADFAKRRGNDAASSMMMKRFRKVINDKKLSMHSLRHRMKDKLRNSGCPEDVSLAILGHSANTIAANYGSGYAVEVMREQMEKAWSEKAVK